LNLKEKIILLDMDDTVNDFIGKFWTTHNELFNENVDPSLTNDWDLTKFSKQGAKVYDIFKHPGLFRHLEPKENAVDFVKQLNNDFDVYFVTDSPAGTSFCEPGKPFSNPADDKRKWIQEHFPFFDHSKIIFSSHKWLIQGDILVDDKPATFLKFQEMGRDAILMDAPHNQHINTKYRAKNLLEAQEMIYELIRK
jgi:5'(3')-deoxyribonucleotidase